MHFILDKIEKVTPDDTKEVVSLIKMNKTSPDLGDQVKLQALNKAVSRKLNCIVAALIEIGLDLNVQLASGETLLFYALRELSENNSIKPILERKLIDNEVSKIKNTINVKVDLNKIDNKHQKTPLMMASMNGNLLRVKALLELGAPIDTRSNSMSLCKTALMLAAIEGQEEIVAYLLMKGANVHLKTISRPGVATEPKGILDLISDQYGTNYDKIRSIINNAMNISPISTSAEVNYDTLQKKYRNESKDLIQMQKLLQSKKRSIDLLQDQIKKFELLINQKEIQLSELRQHINNKRNIKPLPIKIEESTEIEATQSAKRSSPENIPLSITGTSLFYDKNKRQKYIKQLDETFNFNDGVIDDLDSLIPK